MNQIVGECCNQKQTVNYAEISPGLLLPLSCQSYAKCSQWAGQGRSRKPKINEPDDILIFDSKILLTGQTVILRVQLCTQRQNNVVSQMVKSISSYKVQFVTKY